MDYARDHSPTPLEWAQDILQSMGYDVKEHPHSVRTMPWSKVTRFSTTRGYVFLKEMAPFFSLEPTLIQTLNQWESDHLPKIIAENQYSYCFLMLDAGVPLREYQQGVFQLEHMITAIDICAKLQSKSAMNLDVFFAIGVSDWRVTNFPGLYNQMMQQEEILRTDGLTPGEIKSLNSAHDKVSELSQSLSAYTIPSTIETMDFQDNNVLIKHNHITIADWGDAVVSHPFFSLASCLNSAKRNYRIQETDESYHLLVKHYLKHWLVFETHERLIEAFQVAKQLRLIQVALSFNRVNKELQLGSSYPFKGYMANALRDFMKCEN